MKNRVIIFDLKYTPYNIHKNANEYERQKHQQERAFFNMTGESNIFKYIITEGKQTFTALDYLQKNTGVFNDKGTIAKEQITQMKERAKANTGNIWHGFISFNAQDSEKINTPDKCISLIKSTFPAFLKDAKFSPENIDLMCALHTDRPHHLHIHFVFWEKEEKFKCKDGTFSYRKKGKISEEAIDNMFARLALFADGGKDEIYKARDNSLKKLRKMTCVKKSMYSTKEIKDEILSLAKDLPATGRLSYGSKDMIPYRERVDKIVKMLLDYDKEARQANLKFYDELEKKKIVILNTCSKDNRFLSDNNSTKAESERQKHYPKIDENNINVLHKIEEDYIRRQGNLVLNLCKFIKPEYFERKRGKKYKVNDNKLKRSLTISRRNTTRRFDKFFLSFGEQSQLLERDFSHRLQEIEQEFEQERKLQADENKNKEDNYKD
jgi:hypothetical protein